MVYGLVPPSTDPIFFSSNTSPLLQKQLSSLTSVTSRGTAPQSTHVPRLEFVSIMGDMDLSTGATMKLYHGDVGLQPVLQIAGACLSRISFLSEDPHPLPRDGARLVTILPTKRRSRSHRSLHIYGFPRSADRHPRYSPRPRSSRPEQA